MVARAPVFNNDRGVAEITLYEEHDKGFFRRTPGHAPCELRDYVVDIGPPWRRP